MFDDLDSPVLNSPLAVTACATVAPRPPSTARLGANAGARTVLGPGTAATEGRRNAGGGARGRARGPGAPAAPLAPPGVQPGIAAGARSGPRPRPRLAPHSPIAGRLGFTCPAPARRVRLGVLPCGPRLRPLGLISCAPFPAPAPGFVSRPSTLFEIFTGRNARAYIPQAPCTRIRARSHRLAASSGRTLATPPHTLTP